MAMVYTCTKCDTRSVKTFNRSSYERGLVMVGVGDQGASGAS